MTYSIDPARPEDAKNLSLVLREADRREIHSLTPSEPSEAILATLGLSLTSYCLKRDGGPVALFGAGVAHEQNTGWVWLVGSTRLKAASLFFLRNCRKWIDRLMEDGGFTKLFNYADSRNEVHLRWLRWAGFELRPELARPARDGTEFIYFEKCVSTQ